jgi:two-component system sensor histidine kinase BaeS
VSLASRLVLTVALTAVFSVTLTGVLSYRAAGERVPRAFGVMAGPRGQGAGAAAAAEERSAMAAASRALLAELQRATVQAAGIALLLAVVVGGAVALRTTRPLAQVADVTRRYGAGERGLRAPTSGPAEIADLGRVFNETADRLQAEEDQRRRFTTDVAHELRTPLTVLKSELEAIQDGLMDSDPETVAQLLQQVDLLARMVQDLRLLTLAEAGELTLHREPVDLAAVVGGAARGFGSRAGEAGVRIEVETQPVSAVVDGERLHQVVNALLDNALHHAPQTSVVRVALAERGPQAVIEVLDEGPGIPPEHLAHVFRRLYRTDDARVREAGGSGLGLAIVAAIVALHGGTVVAANRPTGGARFTVRLPLAAATPVPTRATMSGEGSMG